jgi:hypothetical protein
MKKTLNNKPEIASVASRGHKRVEIGSPEGKVGPARPRDSWCSQPLGFFLQMAVDDRFAAPAILVPFEVFARTITYKISIAGMTKARFDMSSPPSFRYVLFILFSLDCHDQHQARRMNR